MSPTDTNDDDPSFVALSARLRHRIDDAFDSIVSQRSQPVSEVSAGGFIVDEPEYEAGGFIIDDISSNSVTAQSYIPLSEVPHALNLLGLFPDDDLMRVFKEAAAGWGAQNAGNDGVSRMDWRAICAAILEGEPHVGGNDEDNLIADPNVEVGADSGPDSDEYQMEELSGDTDVDEDSSDDYVELGRTSKGTKTQNVSRKTLIKSSAGPESSKQLTESQRTQCRQDFSRFFPHVPDNELDRQRIMIKDITRVANLLKENLKTEEVRVAHSVSACY